MDIYFIIWFYNLVTIQSYIIYFVAQGVPVLAVGSSSRLALGLFDMPHPAVLSTSLLSGTIRDSRFILDFSPP